MRRLSSLALLVALVALIATPAVAVERNAAAASPQASIIERGVIVLVGLWEKYLGILEPFGDEASSPFGGSSQEVSEATPEEDSPRHRSF